MGLKRWFRRRPSDDEMREELEAHVAMRAEHDGVDEAAARRRLGNLLHTRESMRRVWIAEWWDALRQDARFTWRSWRRQPGFALTAVLVLALGLGASTAMFSALDRILFRPLPYGDADRLVNVGMDVPAFGAPAKASILHSQRLPGALEAGAGTVHRRDHHRRARATRATSPNSSPSVCCAPRSKATSFRRWVCGSPWAAISRPKTTCAARRPSRSSATTSGRGASARTQAPSAEPSI